MAGTRFGNLNEIVSITERGSERALTIQAQRAFINGVKAMGKQIDPELKNLAKQIDLRKIPRGQLKETNLRIARQAQQAVVSGWVSRLPEKSLPYRPEARLTGRLGRALEDDSMTSQTTDKVISPLNVRVLNNEAEHWWRVNYGARGPNLAEGREVGEYPIEVAGGGVVATLRDPSPPASQSWLPRVFVWQQTSVGGAMFVPLRGPADVQGKGVRAARFTDLALKSVAETVVPYTLQGYKAFLGQQADKVRGSTKRVRVSGNRGG
jgi:hypothetical protein